MVILHELLCAALFYSVFCRAVRTCDRVRVLVRLAFFGLGVVACAGAAAPLVWGMVPTMFGLALLAAITAVQMVTAHYWAAGVPDRFYKPGCTPTNRRSTDLLCQKKEGRHAANFPY